MEKSELNLNYILTCLKNQIKIINVLWAFLFLLPDIFNVKEINKLLNFFHIYFQQPISSLFGLLILSIWYFKSSFNTKYQICKWSIPFLFLSLKAYDFNGNWSINTLIMLFFLTYLIFIISILYHKYLRLKSKTLKINEGLISDDPIESELEGISYDRTTYAKSIVAEVIKTRNARAFNISITGKWGSGKTSFLNLMRNEINREELTGKFILVDYNPWDFKEEKIIGIDLLKKISHEIGNEKELQEKFKGLMLSLQGMNQSFWYKIVPYLLNGISNEKSLKEYREEIGKELSKQDKKLIIFLDDLDRLDGEEILEIFKTIRNSFDIANTFFVLGFDIDYVVDQIKDKLKGEDSQDRAIEYLDKIFQMKLFMPSNSDYSFYQEYKQLVKLHLKVDISVDYDNHFQINSKRALYQLINSLKVFFNQENINDYNFDALVKVEILKITDPKCYNHILENADNILNNYSFIKSGPVGPAGNSNQRTISNQLEYKIDGKSKGLLESFFNELEKTQNNRISRKEFLKYFKYSLQIEEFPSSILAEVLRDKNKDLLFNNLTESNQDSLVQKINGLLENGESNIWLQILCIELLYKEKKYIWQYNNDFFINNYLSYNSIKDIQTKLETLELRDKIIFLSDLNGKDDVVFGYLINLFSIYFNGKIDDAFWRVYHALNEDKQTINSEHFAKYLNIITKTVKENYLNVIKVAISKFKDNKGGHVFNHTDPGSNSYTFL
jgi:Cdc6-like AAA superfamily ATPase